MVSPAAIISLIKDFFNKYGIEPNVIQPVIQPMPTPNPDMLYSDWSLVEAAHHNVRALCDLEGLTFEQKQVLAACVKVESGFNINAHNTNYGFSTEGKRYVASQDWGIVQVNDYFHIGPNKDFPNVPYVLSNPEICVRWMCRYYKQHGHLNAWCSFTSGAYKVFLNKV